MSKKEILKRFVVFKNTLRGIIAIGFVFVILVGTLNAMQGTF